MRINITRICAVTESTMMPDWRDLALERLKKRQSYTENLFSVTDS